MPSDSKHLLVIGKVWPEPASSAAGRRMMDLLSLFREKGWRVTFASAAERTPHSANLVEAGIEERSIRMNSASFDDFLDETRPEAVLFDRFMTEEQFGWRVAEQCPEAIRILDTEDLHCLRRARQRAVKQERPFALADLLAEETAKREIASILRSDLSLIISEAEMELLTGRFGVKDSLLHYLPFLIEPLDEREAAARQPSFEERKHFVTIGNFRHAPNRDAVRYMEAQIWPRIRRELPETELQVYGAYPDRVDRALHNPEQGFHVMGRADDARAAVGRARVLLAPLRFGAGLKGKLVEAMECGTPSVTTEIGAEGIAGEREWSGAVADEPEAFVAAAVQLYSDTEVWSAARDRGFRIINNRFSKEIHRPGLPERIRGLRERLEEHRLEHFTGRMLMHHSMASTRYMSLWIEEKNRG
ncbi:MAG: glycosyltransferase [Balneolaceae bacterium]|nr:glycosyltransferase [Balneolaceae bacterium]